MHRFDLVFLMHGQPHSAFPNEKSIELVRTAGGAANDGGATGQRDPVVGRGNHLESPLNLAIEQARNSPAHENGDGD